MKKKKSWLLKLLEWIHPYLSDNVVGWIYASNSIICFVAFYLIQTWLSFMMGVFLFLVAVMFWTSPPAGSK